MADREAFREEEIDSGIATKECWQRLGFLRGGRLKWELRAGVWKPWFEMEMEWMLSIPDLLSAETLKRDTELRLR